MQGLRRNLYPALDLQRGPTPPDPRLVDRTPLVLQMVPPPDFGPFPGAYLDPDDSLRPKYRLRLLGPLPQMPKYGNLAPPCDFRGALQPEFQPMRRQLPEQS